MKRLFEVNGEFFADKKVAKAARGEPVKPARTEKVDGRDISLPPEYKHAIGFGPDHWRRGGEVPGHAAAKPVAVKRVRKAPKKAEVTA